MRPFIVFQELYRLLIHFLLLAKIIVLKFLNFIQINFAIQLMHVLLLLRYILSLMLVKPFSLI